MSNEYDVAIIGGGPAGSTTGTLLKKYNPDVRVLILEREVFPRDHIGESQLPPIVGILAEMEVWDKVEAADFPIKIGGTYRWGKSPELWDLEFVPRDVFKDEPRPGKLEGVRQHLPFQVDRSIYDKILLDHAASFGVEVRENTKVVKILREGDRVTGLQCESGDVVTAKHYVDASGTSAILRRGMDVEADYPTTLQNIAIWDYWQNAEWAVKIGVGGTRIQVRSLGYGWIWFIPLGPTRTSIGLVIPAEYYKKSGKKPRELLDNALQEETTVASLLKNATCENRMKTTKDWSNLAKKMTGENWFLVGESAGFADPILSAGLTIAHRSAREAAFTILELLRGGEDASWLKDQFSSLQSQRILTHIRFADFWYTANAQFKDLKQFTAGLAEDAGLELTPEKAWEWIGKGGFIHEDSTFGTGGFSLALVKRLGEFLTELAPGNPVESNNVFELSLEGATWKKWPNYNQGRVIREEGYARDGKVLTVTGPFKILVKLLQRNRTANEIVQALEADFARQRPGADFRPMFRRLVEALEAMIYDGWVLASYDPSLPKFPPLGTPLPTERWNTDTALEERQLGAS